MVNFATDPGTDVFLRGIDAGERARKARNAVAVDAAVRRGLAASLGGDAAGAAALAPVPGVGAATPPAAPVTPPAPALAPAPQGAPPAAAVAQMRGRGGEPLEGAPDAPPAPAPAAAPAPAVQPPQAAPAPRAAGPVLAPAPGVVGARPVGDRYESVLRELAGVEGGGAAALGVMQQQDRNEAISGRRREQLARLAMYAMKQGDTATAQYFSTQAGIPLPNIRGGGRQMTLVGAAALEANKIYGHNRQQAQAYVQALLANGGDRVAAMAEAAKIPDPVWKQVWVENRQTGQVELYNAHKSSGKMVRVLDDDGNPFIRAPTHRVVQTEGGYATVNPQSGAARPVMGADGQPIQAPPRGGAGGPRAGARPLDREVKRDMLIAAGVSPTDAALIAAGGTLSPSAAAVIRQRIIAGVDADYTLKGDTPDKIQARRDAVERQFRQVVDALSPVRQGGGTVTPVTPSVTPVTPAPALPRAPTDAPALAPAPAPPAPALPAGVREGQRIRQGGVVYQVRNGQLVQVQ